MGRRAGIPRPNEAVVPPGPRRDLVLALHDLYEAAGWPSVARTARGLAEDEFERYPAPMNHQLIAQFLHGRTIASLAQVRALAMIYADKCDPPRDYRAADEQIRILWQAAKTVDASRTAAPAILILPRQTEGSPNAVAPASPAPTHVQSALGAKRRLLAEAAAQLADARTAHGGLPIEAVENVARSITPAMKTLFTEQAADIDIKLNVAACSEGCTFNRLPYRPAPGDNALKVRGDFPRVGTQIQMTPVVGIAIERDAEHAFVIFDANVADGDALLLTLDEVRRKDFAAVGCRLDGWIERKLAAQLQRVTQDTRSDARGGR